MDKKGEDALFTLSIAPMTHTQDKRQEEKEKTTNGGGGMAIEIDRWRDWAYLLPSGGNEVEVLASLRARHVLGQRQSHRR
ncbi:hypothetical protein PRIPAC_96547 [Pristionchus pacificus]|uniref:Uncharacterized protein n=1 Tax=Pristionchus pacificus TaxID=54126 RepID=A0A2A6D2U7_PRIPA|nr:hypothetical protein PRIPAC_96547 [Pristionchus pacificus]|eukprot:PDM84666.1 hypothetical protein PRIPAC_33689 [Pristionchus pacificus]